tara:strand:+ start:1762 stop:3906 length:2145 start_codon:yes stop_codon:yes gene_type:complete
MSSNQDFSNKILLVEFDFDGRTYYTGTEGFASENYYQPIVTTASNIQIGSSSGGYMSVSFGNITISNDPKDRNSPFNLHTGSFARLLNNPNQLIDVRVYWGKQLSALFEGTMYFSSMKEDQMSFVLEAQDFPQNALIERSTDNAEDTSQLGNPLASGGNFSSGFNSFAVDFTVELHNWSTTSTVDNSIKLKFIEPHGLAVGQVMYLDFVPTDGTDSVDADIYANKLVRFTSGDSYIMPLGSVTITEVSDNDVVVATNYEVGSDVGTPNILGYWTLYNFPSNVAPWMFGEVEKEEGILKHPDTDDNKYWNPLKHTGTDYIYLYDDGILVGTNDPNDIDTTINDSTEFWKLTFNTAELETFKTSYPVTAMYGNGSIASSTTNFPALYVGDQVTVSGSVYDSLNGTFQVSRVINSNTFTFQIYNIGTDIPSSGIITDNASRVGKNIIRYGNYFGSDRLPTEDYIFTRKITVAEEEGVSNISGVPLVSGMGKHGETLYEFFTWCQNELGVSNFDYTLAPDLNNKKISVAVQAQIRVTELMGRIAESTNHLCYIRDDILYVIDLGYSSPSIINIPSYNIVSASVTNEYPISYIETEFTKKVVYDENFPITIDDDKTVVRVDNVSVGNSQSVDAVSKVVVDNRTYLQAIMNHRKKAKMAITVNDVRLDIVVGGRVQFSREEEQISYDMIVDSINYNFKSLQTQFSGRGSISVIEREGIFQ